MINEEQVLREHIKKAISLFQNKKLLQEQKIKQDENKLRGIIRTLLKEVAEDQPKHDSTGINVLEDLLKRIIPTIKMDFKFLTTSFKQRQSFRSHIVNAVQNSLSSERVYSDNENDNINEEVAIKVDDESKFIDIEPKEPEEVSPEEEFSKGLEAKELDSTGRNMAMSTYKKIEKNIIDAYSLLDDVEDKDLFYDYLITNLKLYFDKFEEELQNKVTEPTTAEYEKEKKLKTAENTPQ